MPGMGFEAWGKCCQGHCIQNHTFVATSYESNFLHGKGERSRSMAIVCNSQRKRIALPPPYPTL